MTEKSRPVSDNESSWIKKVLHLIGSTFGVVGIIFVAQQLYVYSEEIDFSGFDVGTWIILATLALVYGVGNALLSTGWWSVLHFFGLSTTWIWSWRVYGLSQLAKYVPGNIFHLAGRQALAMAAGLSGKALVKSTLWDLGSLAVSGALFSALVLPLLFPVIPLWIALVLFFTGWFFLVLIAQLFVSKAVGDTVFVQVLFLGLSGLIFYGAVTIVSTNVTELPLFPLLVGAFVVSWLIGFVTPGAPAGVGVRELVLLFLLKDQMETGSLLLAVVLGRAITVSGDLFYFCLALLVRQKVEQK